MNSSCPICRSQHGLPVAEFPDLPVLCNQLFQSRDDARNAQRGDISLVVCPGCGLIWNAAFDPDLMAYGSGYENALHFSPRFRDFADALVKDLTSRHALAGGTIFEIGCGDGFMLDLFVKHGASAAVGFDPSMEGRETQYAEREGVEIIAKLFDAGALGREVDFILCRHVLEHIEDPASFISEITEALVDRDIPLYFEVPNAEWMLSAPSPWDVIYEHVTYWTTDSMTALFQRSGLTPVSVATVYGDQFLSIEARPGDDRDRAPVCETAAILDLSKRFSEEFSRQLDDWQEKLSTAPGSVVVWGTGSKGITFANVLSNMGCDIAAMVDLNPKKHGRYIPGAGIPVVPPSKLRQLDPKLILISNGLYKTEIIEEVEELGIDARFEVISV